MGQAKRSTAARGAPPVHFSVPGRKRLHRRAGFERRRSLIDLCHPVLLLDVVRWSWPLDQRNPTGDR